MSCVFYDNHSVTNGGAVSFYDQHATIDNCTFELCGAPTGGAVNIYRASCDITNSVFRNNNTGSGGGAVNARVESALTVSNCVFEGNRSHYDDGGAIYLYDVTGSVDNCLFKGNSAARIGGAVFYFECSLDFEHCTFLGNTVGSVGAAIGMQDNSLPTYRYCTFSENSSDFPDDGCTIYCSTGSHMALENCIIAHAPEGYGIFTYANANPTLTDCCVFGNAWGPSNDQAVIDQLGQNGNITLDPQFCGVLGSGNVNLQSDSPCAPDNHGGVLIGACPVGCGTTAAEKSSIGEIKALY